MKRRRHRHTVVMTGETESLEKLAGDAEARGEFDEAKRFLLAAIERRRLEGAPFALVRTLSRLSAVQLASGQYYEAGVSLEEGRRLFVNGLNKITAEFLELVETESELDESRGFMYGAFLNRVMAAEVAKKLYGANHPEFAVRLRLRARMEIEMEMLDIAGKTLAEAFRIVLDNGVPDERTAGEYAQLLAHVHLAKGNYDAALPLFEDCAIVSPGGMPAIPIGLAATYVGLGRLHDAILTLEELLASMASARTAKSLVVVKPIASLALIRAAIEDSDRAMPLAREAESVWQYHLANAFSVSTDEERSVFAARVREQSAPGIALFLSRATRSGGAARECLELLWKRKAVATGWLADQQKRVREHPSTLVHRWSDERRTLQEEIATRWFDKKPADEGRFQAEMYRLVEQSDRLEKKIAAELGISRMPLHSSGVAEVALALPERGVLIEYVRAHRFDPRAFQNQFNGGEAYFVFVVPAGRNAEVRCSDLGSAHEIDELIVALDANIVPRAGSQALTEILHALEHKLLDPIARDLDEALHLVIAPDSEVGRVPFAALRDRVGRYLGDRFTISFVNRGDEVLRHRAPAAIKDRNADIVIANPDFQYRDGAPAEEDSQSEASLSFKALPHSHIEGVGVIQELGQPAQLFEGRVASKQVLLESNSPRILHLATHGFVLAPRKDMSIDFELGFPFRDASLLRSGFALAGAQAYLEGRSVPPSMGNGIVTALEIAGMNLYGTELVVVSACKSGLGDVRTGEAIYGLRRSFFVAGAKRLLISLWNVSDRHTAELMTAFYRYLMSGTHPSAALQQAQAQVRLVAPHPFYWAAFVLLGDPNGWQTES